jgi:predicted DNA-binding transcriptional regulator AlpA
MRLEQAAAYLSISTSSFLRLVEEGALPPAIKRHSMALWDRLDLDAAFENWKTPSGPSENTVHKLLRERQHDRKTKIHLP